MRAITEAADPEAAARELRALLEEPRWVSEAVSAAAERSAAAIPDPRNSMPRDGVSRRSRGRASRPRAIRPAVRLR